MTVRLHIDRLVVDAGLAADPRALEREIGAALQAALAAHGSWQPVTYLWRRVEAAPGAPLGAAIGEAVHAAVTGSLGDSAGQRR